jgi:hypothetical protein
MLRQRRRIVGRTGTVARTVIGLAFLALGVTVYGAGMRDVVVGVVVLPARRRCSWRFAVAARRRSASVRRVTS